MPTEHVYPFGRRNGDNTVPQAIDGHVGPIPLVDSLIYFQQEIAIFSVSSKGQIHFMT